MGTEGTQHPQGRSMIPSAARGVAERVAQLRPAHRGRPRRVVVWEKSGTLWKVLEGEIGGDRPRVLSAEVVRAEADSQVPTGRRTPPRSAQSVLMVRSRRSLCRRLELPMASGEEMRRLVSLRLETELPYAPSELTWAYQCEDGAEGRATSGVLVVAVPTAEIKAAERELQPSGRPPQRVESHEAALAQVAASLAPGSRTAAIAEMAADGAALAVVHDGSLTYARQLAGPAGGAHASPSRADDASRLAGEIDQSLRHYVLRTGAPAPEKLLLVGESELAGAVAEAFESDGRVPVELPSAPQGLDVARAAGDAGSVCRGFAACIGALIASHRRLCRQRCAAPLLRLPEGRRHRTALRGRIALLAANLVLVAALVTTSFGVRSATLSAARRTVKEGRTLFESVEKLQEEVKILEAESARRRSMLDVLLALGEALPNGVQVSDLDVDSKGNVTIKGKAPSIEAASRAESALSASETFAKAKLWQISQEEKGGRAFRITCVLR